jgi:DNA-binding response OmpR family regulator
MYHIMIVEDDENIRQELSLLLNNALYQVSAVTNFHEVAKQIMVASPDLVLLDMNLPGAVGVAICKELRSNSDVPIIFVTGNNSTIDELECLQQGGDDFIAKPFKPSVLLARIQTVLKRTAKIQEHFSFCHREVTLDVAAATISANGQKIDLTKNEMKILHCLFTNTGSYVSRGDLTDYLWDNQVFIDDNALSVNMTRIRGKLSELGVEDFIETKRGLGYKI